MLKCAIRDLGIAAAMSHAVRLRLLFLQIIPLCSHISSNAKVGIGLRAADPSSPIQVQQHYQGRPPYHRSEGRNYTTKTTLQLTFLPTILGGHS